MLHNSLKFFCEKDIDTKLKEAVPLSLNATTDNKERRAHYRLKVTFPFELSLFEDSRFCNACAVDISCGGAGFSCNVDMEQYSLIYLHFNIGGDYVRLTGRVLHKRYSKSNGYIYSYGAEYADISQREQQVIYRFIFDEHKSRIRIKRKISEPFRAISWTRRSL